MARSAVLATHASPPAVRDVVELLKPITWFPPMWAFGCGAVSSGMPLAERWPLLILGLALTGPLVCGTSQAVNDWFDRHVDAINEPDRPIPSGRVGGRWGLYVALAGSVLAAGAAWAAGPLILVSTLVALFFAWAYSAPPLRFKASGWIGPLVVGLSYEGLSWFTGAAAMTDGMPSVRILTVLLLYSLGAHGIMTLNDFKAVEGDRATGVRSLPVVLGERPAAVFACAAMALPQAVVIALLLTWSMAWSAALVGVLLLAQFTLMPRLVAQPKLRAPWYSATGVSLYVLGMLAASFGLGSYF
jgi:chlorophyll synthase